MSRNHRSHYFGGDEKPRIEIIPMIDVMMFLMVFFVLIMTEMIQSAGIPLDLPQSSTSKQMEARKLTIGVDKAGVFYLEGQASSEDQIAQKLQTLQAEQPDQRIDVLITGDKTTAYQNIIKAMDLVRAQGIASIGMATQN